MAAEEGEEVKVEVEGVEDSSFSAAVVEEDEGEEQVVVAVAVAVAVLALVPCSDAVVLFFPLPPLLSTPSHSPSGRC